MGGKLRGRALTLCAKPQVQASEGKKYTRTVCLCLHLAEALGVDLVETENRVDDSTFWGPEKSADVLSLSRC